MQTQQFYFLLLDLVLLVAPFLVNLYFKIPGIKTVIVNYLKTYSIVGILITLLLSLIVSRTDILFNPKFLTGFVIGNLPIELILFFFTMPFASIALYELISVKFKEKRILLDNTFFYLFTFTYFVLAVIFSPHVYTNLIFILLGVLMLVVSHFRKNNIFLTKNFYLFSLLSIVTFIIIAAVVTASPFVTFSANAYTGFNIGSIPFEEFFTSFFILSTFLTVYYLFKKREA